MTAARTLLSLAAAAFTAAMAAAPAGAADALRKERLDAVEAGGGTRDEQVRYILMCMESAPCGAALMQIWQANGKDVALERYLPPADKVPALFRGTDIGRTMVNIGAVNNCAPDDACRSFLVGAVKAVRALPPAELNRAHALQAGAAQQPAQRDSQQIKTNLAQALERAAAGAPLAAAPAAAGTPAGGVVDFARDPYANVTVQLVQRADGNREIQLRGAEQTRRLATVLGREGKWLIELNDGKQVEAADILLTSRGFVAGSAGQPISYSESGGLVKVNWPQGFRTASLQRGDTARTGYILLERDTGQRGSTANLLHSFKSLGSKFGGGPIDDYLLLDLHSGATTPINISAAGKSVAQMSGCRAKNAVVNVCRDASFREALNDSTGKNLGHYGWLVYWMRAPGGTWLIALEDNLRRVAVTKLETGEKRIAFERGLGIADLDVKQDDAGKIAITAKLAFDIKRIEDLDAAFAGLPAAVP